MIDAQKFELEEAVRDACRTYRNRRVFSLEHKGITYFVKQHMKHKRWGFRWGDGFAEEVRRMRYAGDTFAAAPPVVLATDEFMVTTAAGVALNEIIRQPDEEYIKQAFFAAGQCLARMHAGGCVHGRPAARDIVYDRAADKAYFVDWENTYKVPGIDKRLIDLLLFIQGYFREEIDKEYALKAAVNGYVSNAEGCRLFRQIRQYVQNHRRVGNLVKKWQYKGGVDWRSLAMAIVFFLD